MKTRAAMIWKRYKKGIACALTGILLVLSCYPAEAEELAARESISENTVEEAGFGEAEGKIREAEDASRESGTPETEELLAEDTEGKTSGQEERLSGETVSENSISENSVSENSAEIGMPTADEELAENGEEQSAPEESVSENSTEETVSENTTSESVSENTVEGSEETEEESVSENSAGESVSENTTGESVSENTTPDSVSANTMSVNSMSAEAGSRASVPPTAPVIKSIVPKDTTAEIRFTHLLEGEQSTGILYEVLLTDEVNGAQRTLSGKEPGVITIDSYDGKALNTFQMNGLFANKKYSVVLRAKYGDTGEPVSSTKKAFTTKKDMIATNGSVKVRYADMEAMKNDRTKKPEEVPTAGVEMKTGESCALYAQVSRLMRAVETDKLKWTVTPLNETSPKNGLKVKASKSTYEAVLTAQKPGSYQVTATNTLSKEEAAHFQVTVK